MQIGCDISIKDSMGRSLIHLAAYTGNEYFIIFFKEKGLDINGKDLESKTPLHLAILRDHLESSFILIRFCDEIDCKDNEMYTPLHYAAFVGNYKIIRQLIHSKASLESKDIKGDTPLQISMHRSEKKVISLLVTLIQKGKKNLFFNGFSRESKANVVVLLILMIFITSLIYVNIYLHWNSTDYIQMIPGITSTISLLLQISLIIIKPRYSASEPKKIDELYKELKSRFVCIFCEQAKPKGAKHCFICKKCIKVWIM